MRFIILAHIALFLANTIYAINYIFAKDVMPDYISPTAFILLRVMGASIVFSIIHWCFFSEKIKGKDLLYLFVCALFGVVINMLCFFEGLNITTPINASLIMITTPLIVYLISCFLNKEGLSIRFFGVLLGLSGAGLLITGGDVSLKFNNLGDILVFLNATSYAVYLILIKSMMNKYHPITVLKTIFLMGFIILIPIGYTEFSEIKFSNMPISIISKSLFVVFFTTCFAYFLNIYALSKLRSSTVAFYIYLQPLLASVFAVLLGKDVLTGTKLISGLLIFAGVFFVLKRPPS